MTECNSFAPNINNQSRILILGSMPGIKSLEEQRYYAHPQNRFWILAGLLCDYNNLAQLNYKDKLKVLLQNKIALWDVIKSCKRTGSLDLNIKNLVPNDISGLLKQYDKIQIICLNGSKAYSTFKKYFPEILEKYQCFKLPSTSPANARYRLEDLYQEWSAAINPFLNA